jgi:hypothetical protein
MTPVPQIEIIYCLEELEMADDKKPKKRDTTPVEECLPKPGASTTNSGGGPVTNPPTPPKKPEPIEP